MSGARRDIDALACLKRNVTVFELDSCCSGQNEKELVSLVVRVQNLTGSRRNTLLNYAEIRKDEESPTVANLSPSVVLGRISIDWIQI